MGGEGRQPDGLPPARADERGEGVTLGTLVAIRRAARRVVAGHRPPHAPPYRRAEIGLQLIANTLVGVDLVEQRKGVEPTTRSTARPTDTGRTFQGLFLSFSRREGEPACNR